MAIVLVPNDAKEVMPENFQKTEIDRLRSVTQKRGGIIISERPATMDAPGCFSAYEPSEQTRTALHSYDCVVDYDEHWYTLNVFLETTLFDSIEANRLASERLAQRIRFH